MNENKNYWKFLSHKNFLKFYTYSQPGRWSGQDEWIRRISIASSSVRLRAGSLTLVVASSGASDGTDVPCCQQRASNAVTILSERSARTSKRRRRATSMTAMNTKIPKKPPIEAPTATLLLWGDSEDGIGPSVAWEPPSLMVSSISLMVRLKPDILIDDWWRVCQR